MPVHYAPPLAIRLLLLLILHLHYLHFALLCIHSFSFPTPQDVLIDSDSRDRGRITDSIVNRKYDLIILGSGHRDGWASKLHFWDLVCKHYHPLEVAWIDGSDKPAPKRLLDKYSVCAGHMFSREGFAED